MFRYVGLAIVPILMFHTYKGGVSAADWQTPYDPPRTKRVESFEFSQKPNVKFLGHDKFEISFAVKAACDATVALVDEQSKIVRHLASGVLGKNAPPPFQKNALQQKLIWDGKDDLEEYVREPERLRVRVSLGLKAQFDKQLGPDHPKNLPGYVLGIAVSEEGAFVFSRGQGAHNNVHLRKYGLDGKYLQSLAPPPANLPKEKLSGRASIEYEPGTFAHHGPTIQDDMGYDGNVIPGLGKKSVADIQPVVVGKRIFFCNSGPGHRAGTLVPSELFYLYTNGATDLKGLEGRRFVDWATEHLWPKFAASPDGKWLYMTGLAGGRIGNGTIILRCSVDGDEFAKPFIGKFTRKGSRVNYLPGSDNESLNNPMGIDTDSKGCIYVCDSFNNRIQVFTPDGKFFKSIKVERPRLLCVHKKTGALYIQHIGRITEGKGRGKSTGRISKLISVDQPNVEFFVNGVTTGCMALDSWSKKPKLWLGGGIKRQGSTITSLYNDSGPSVTVWEESGKKLKLISDFDEEAKKKAGNNYIGRWSGGVADHVVCDPTRDQAYFLCYRNNPFVFDLKSGKKIKRVHFPGSINDIDFCKRGYLHMHFDPGFYMPGVGRQDPSQSSEWKDHLGRAHKDYVALKEVPYDYGIQLSRPHKPGFIGGIAVRDQPGAKYFQDGFGVDMQGNLAVQSNIYFVPKMEEAGWGLAAAGRGNRDQAGELSGPSRYPDFLKKIREQQKRGELVYSIPRRPGIPLAGATIWTYDSSGELRTECAAIAGGTMAGVHMDTSGNLYFVTLNAKLIDGKPFLYGRGGTMGADKPIDRYNKHPFTGTLIRSRGKDVRFYKRKSTIPMDPLPNRPTDVIGYDSFGSPQKGAEAWVEGADWMYAGVSPAVSKGCTCPSSRFHLDWHRRSYVAEAYRHSIGVVDTAGNLIMHIGQYGNYDSGQGKKSTVPLGGDGIGLTLPRFISGTEDYLCFDDWGERLVVLKLGYHKEESAKVSVK